MAAITCSNRHVAITSGSKVKVISYSNPSDSTVFELKVKPKETEERKHEEQEEPKKTDEEVAVGNDPHAPTGRVLASAFSASGTYFAACTDEKELTLWTTQSGWSKLWTRTVVKRCMAVTFNNSETALFVADKAGDVYRYELHDDDEEPSLILGHVSMLLDVAISPDDSFILTAERDEKIRVSHLPNAYNIHTICLGHTEFISRLVLLSSNHLISCAGDSTMRLWNYKEGKELCQTSFDWARPSSQDDGDKNEATVTCISCSKEHSLVAVTLLDHSTVPVYHIAAQQDGSWTFQEVTRLQCKHPPWSLSFDSSGRIMVLVPDPEKPLLVFVVERKESGTFQVSEDISSEGSTALLAQNVRKDWEFLNCFCSVQSAFRGLHKVPFDNMSDYLQRKQQRMENNQTKKGRRKQARKLNKRPLADAADNGDASKRTMLDVDDEEEEEDGVDDGENDEVNIEEVKS